jgi:hypothetical protein
LLQEREGGGYLEETWYRPFTLAIIWYDNKVRLGNDLKWNDEKMSEAVESKRTRRENLNEKELRNWIHVFLVVDSLLFSDGFVSGLVVIVGAGNSLELRQEKI